MFKRNSTKQAFFSSVLALILCISMLLGTTFAWFTATVTGAGNIIMSGNLKIDMQWAESYDGENTVWNDAEGANAKPVFDYDNWEPGYTEVRYIKVSNEGSLAFKYIMNIIPTGKVSELAEVIDVQFDIVTDNESFTAPTVDNKKGSLSTVGTLNKVIDNAQTVVSGVLLPEDEEKAGFYSGEIVVCISLHMQESAGNEYQNKSIGDAFNILLLATQYTYESDSFGNLYDNEADHSVYVSQSKKLPEGANSVDFALTNKGAVIASLSVPASAIADVSKPVTVTVDGIDPTETIVVDENTKSFAYDINVTNLKANLTGDQLITVALTVPNALPAVKIYHKGVLIDNAVYDEVEGTITFKTDSFSPYAVSYKEYEVSTIEELRAHAAEDDVNIKLTKDLEINLDPNASENDCDAEHFCKFTGSYEYYNGVNINGKNIAIDLNGHNIVVSGDKDGDTVGAVFFIMPNSNLNITDSAGGGMIKVKDPCYIVWAPYDAEYGLSYVDVYGGIFAAHSYAGDTRTPGYFAMFYAGEGGKVDIRGGYYLYDNESYTDKNGVTYENVNNGAFNVMNSATTECITIHDGVMLINEHYRQDGYNANNKNADHDSIFLAEYCDLVKVSQKVTIDGIAYDTWYQVQTTQPTKFETVFENTDKYTYRVGNGNTVSLGSLFKTNNAIAANANIDVNVTALHNSSVSGTYTAASDKTKWAEGTIKFTGTGLAKITINGYELTVEVVDAMNATSATNATSNNVVLLKDCGFSSLEVSNGYTLYGNGFTMTCSSDSVATDRTYSFVELKGGTLDNVKIVVPNFSHAIMYDKNKSENGNPSTTDASGKTRYYNIRSAVLVTGSSKITNSYISGGRAAVYTTSGTLTVENSTIYGGAVANIQAEASSKLVLEDVTLIQKPIKATVNDTSKTLMGFSVVMMCDTTGVGAEVTLKGYLHQYAWANSTYATYVPSDAKDVVTDVLSQANYVHSITYEDGETRNSVNLGFAYMPDGVNKTNANNMVDERTQSEKDKYPYEATTVKTIAAIYTYKNTNGTDAAVKTEPTYTATTQGVVAPTVKYEDVNANRVFTTTYDATKAQWKSTLKVDVDAGEYAFSFDKLLVQKYGNNLSYTVKTEGGTAVDKSASIMLNSAVSNVYILTITDNQIYGANGESTGETVETTYVFELLATKTSLPAPTWVSKTLSGTPYIVVDAKDSDWNCAVPVLDGLKIKYWSKKQGKEVELNLADVVTAAGLSKGLQNGSNNTITITVADEYTLTITTTGFKTNDNGKPVVVDGKLYFTVSSSSNFVSKSTTSRAPNISYTFTDANNSDPITLGTSFAVDYATYKSKQYKYSDFCNGTLAEATCVTPDTLITLADGSKVRVDSLKGDELLLVWNLETGKLDYAPIMFVDSEAEAEYEVIKLYFSDGTEVKVISEHGFWDYDLNKYVYLDRYANKYIGHTFAKHNGDELIKVQLVDVVLENIVTTAWSPVTVGHLCYFVNDMLSMPGGVGGLFNIFEVDPETMTYDYAALQKDIETYGLFTYEEMNEICPLSEDMFVAAGGAYLKISIGKGNMTVEDLIYMIERYAKYI